MRSKPIFIIAASLFILTCLFPPWQYTEDRNGRDGFHTHKPAGYALIVSPPTAEPDGYGFGVRMDSSRLLIEWAILGVATGLILFLKSPIKK